MSIVRTPSGDVFEVRQEQLEVTRLSRPDIAWRFTDAHGHTFAWHADGKRTPAKGYSPSSHYHVPNLRRVVDVPATDDEPAVIHYECRKCGERVTPRYTSDTTRQFIAGVRECFINGKCVSADEFDRRYREELDKAQRP